MIAEGNHLTVKINGAITAEFIDDRRRFSSGHIALQQHGARMVVEFRKIEIKELGERQISGVVGVVWEGPPQVGRLTFRQDGVLEVEKWSETRRWATIDDNKVIALNALGFADVYVFDKDRTRVSAYHVGRQPGVPLWEARVSGDGFMPLFNGKDTQGWHASEGTKASWRVNGGMLIGSGEIGALITDRKDFENFRLRVEAMLGEGGDSGLCFRVQDEGSGYAYEAQIGGLPGSVTTGSLVLFAGSSVPTLAHAAQGVPPGRWFTMEVLAEGNRFTIWVDGKQTVQYEDKERRYPRGAISLQHISPKGRSEVSFRKVEIKELPPTKVADSK